MTERQRELYNLFLNNATNDYLTRDEICEALPQFYPRYAENGRDKYSSKAYLDIRNDIDAIQRDLTAEKVIVQKGSSYKIASNDKEIDKYKASYRNKAIKTLVKLQTISYKQSKHNQLKNDNDLLRIVKVVEDGSEVD